MNEASQTKGKTEKDSESELLEDRMNVCSFNSVRKSLEQYLISSDVDSTKTFSSCVYLQQQVTLIEKVNKIKSTEIDTRKTFHSIGLPTEIFLFSFFPSRDIDIEDDKN